MDRLDLTSATDYAAFLMISHRGISQVETALDAFGIGAIYPNWPAARRLDCLDADLSAMGERAAGPVRQWLPKSVPEALGALYVLEGSRLGARILLRRASASPDPRVSRNLRYLRHGQDQPLWPDFLEVLENIVTSEFGFHHGESRCADSFRHLPECRNHLDALPDRRIVTMTNDSMISPDDDVDLTSCDREPIHLLGAVQSFGFLIAVSTDWIVSRVSENAADTLGIATETLLGSSLDAVFDRDVIHRLRGLSQGLRGPDSVERTFGVPLVSGQGNFDIAMHQSGHLIVIEAEPSERDETRAAAAVKTMIGRLQATAGIDGLLREAARQVRLLTGFDRVMVYKFDRDGAGEVVAEVVAGGLDRYLGLKYPASDIPRQARALYLRNALRLIWDTTEPGSRIVPPRDPAGAPLDLSLSVLRAVSPIHLEYLTNMGVRASLSISIIVNGKLWGLFACHHMEPRRISLERRTAAELFGQVFSYLLESRQRDDAESYRDKAQLLHDGLMRAVAANGSTVDAILSQIDQLSDLVMADGVGVWIDGHVELHGNTPSMEEFTSLVRHLNQAPAGKIYATEELSAFHPPAADYSDRVAGALAIPISRLPRDYLVFFRREFARSVTWAGNPDKPVSVGPNGTRLTPRKSFAAWQDTVRGQSIPWKSTEISIAESLRVTLLEVILRMKDESDRDRQSAQDRQELLIAELNHRVRNILGLIRGLVTQSQSRAGTVEDFATVIGGRI